MAVQAQRAIKAPNFGRLSQISAFIEDIKVTDPLNANHLQFGYTVERIDSPGGTA